MVLSLNRISISPNPATDVLQFRFEAGNVPALVTIKDLSGRTVITRTSKSSTLTMDISGIAPGIYIVEVATGNARTVQPVSVVR